jgi:transcriptional regulator with XRE-family HTH domain
MALTKLFSTALKHYRELVNLSQENLAVAAELDRTYISQLERGLKSPTLNTLQKLATCLGVEPHYLLREPRGKNGPRFPAQYLVRPVEHIIVVRGGDQVQVSAHILTSAINITHELIDDMYANDLDIAAILGMRNLSAFIGQLYAAAVVKIGDGLFKLNPHQDGYPDLLLMDTIGKRRWDELVGSMNEKQPFSPFNGGGIEIKATCGSVPTPKVCCRRGIERPFIGDTRIDCMTGYDWKSHHRETNNLAGILWDFIGRRPRIAALFYSSELEVEDWGKIVQPRPGGGRTTSVSIMSQSGILKMYSGWQCILSDGRYGEFLNRRNQNDLIPPPV